VPSVRLPEASPQAVPDRQTKAKDRTATIKEKKTKENSQSDVDEWVPDFEELKRELNRKD
jgi:hypothetical protein